MTNLNYDASGRFEYLAQGVWYDHQQDQLVDQFMQNVDTWFRWDPVTQTLVEYPESFSLHQPLTEIEVEDNA